MKNYQIFLQTIKIDRDIKYEKLILKNIINWNNHGNNFKINTIELEKITCQDRITTHTLDDEHKEQDREIARRTLAKSIYILMTSSMYRRERIQRIESYSTGHIYIYIVQFTIYSFTRFNHLLYIAIYHI